KGLCRHIGVSNFNTAKLRTLFKTARLRPEMNQIELHPYLQQDSVVDFCQANRIHLTGYSPLGSTARPAQLTTVGEPVLLEDPVIQKIAVRHSATPAQVVICWAMQRRTAVIPKSVNPKRLKENLSAAAIELTRSEMVEIAALDCNRRYVSGDFWAAEGSPYSVTDFWDE
ncbi:MAG: aldo/keto reductase, partial [Thermodesulfobacteriota bacterium]